MSKKTDTVTLSRAEYEALIERIEDTEDNAFLDRADKVIEVGDAQRRRATGTRAAPRRGNDEVIV